MPAWHQQGLECGPTQGQGLGVCRFRNGNRFEGSFLDGSLSGLGVYTFASQGCYAGQVWSGPASPSQ